MRGGRRAASARRHGAGSARARRRSTSSPRWDCRSGPRVRRRPQLRARRRSPTAPTYWTSSRRFHCSPTATSPPRATSLPERLPPPPRAAPAGRHIVVRAVIETCYLEPAAWRLAARLVVSAGCDGVSLRDRPGAGGRHTRRDPRAAGRAARGRRGQGSGRHPVAGRRAARARRRRRPAGRRGPGRSGVRARRGRQRAASPTGRIAAQSRAVSGHLIPATLCPAPEWRNW